MSQNSLTTTGPESPASRTRTLDGVTTTLALHHHQAPSGAFATESAPCECGHPAARHYSEIELVSGRPTQLELESVLARLAGD